MLLPVDPLLATACLTWTLLSQPGGDKEFRHAAGFVFPAKVGSFKRLERHNYDKKGLDMSVGYQEYSLGITATVYVYPVPTSGPSAKPEGHFKALCAEVSRSNPGAKNVGAKSITMNLGGLPRKGYIGGFDLPRGKHTVQSLLFLFEHKSHYVKYRLTMPMTDPKKQKTAISTLINGIKWP